MSWMMTDQYRWFGPEDVGPHEMWRAQVWWEPCERGEDGHFGAAYYVTPMHGADGWFVLIEDAIQGPTPRLARGPFAKRAEAVAWAQSWIDPSRRPSARSRSIWKRLRDE